MTPTLVKHSYGKSRVRLTRLTRQANGHHDLRELDVEVSLTGDFAASYTHGNNSRVIATDTMKNMVYALAADRPLGTAEEFATRLGRYLLSESAGSAHVGSAHVTIREAPLRRLTVAGQAHPTAFVGGAAEGVALSEVICRRANRPELPPVVTVRAGVTELLIIKTAARPSRGSRVMD